MISQNFDQNSPLVQKFGIKDVPDIVLFKGKKKENWVTGLDSLLIVFETIEKEEELKLK